MAVDVGFALQVDNKTGEMDVIARLGKERVVCLKKECGALV